MAVTLSASPDTYSLTRNIVLVRLLSTSHSGLANYRTILRVKIDTDGDSTYETIAEIEAIPDSAGLSYFYIQNILHAALKRYAPTRVPDIEQPHPFSTGTRLRYRIEYAEKYGDPQAEYGTTEVAGFYAIRGGVDVHYAGLYDFFANVSTSNSLLTYIPSGKKVARSQKDTLTFINPFSGTFRFGLEVKDYDHTGAQVGSTKYIFNQIADSDDDAILLSPYEIAVFPTGPEKLNVASTALKYTVQVMKMDTNTGTPIEAASQVFTYYVDDLYQEQPVDIIWLGSFNNPHILRCTGRKKTGLEISRQLSAQVLGWGYDPSAGETIQHAVDWNYTYTYRTGALRKDEKDALQELLIENIVLEHDAEDGNYYRLLISDSRYDTLEQRVSPDFLEFSAQRSLAPGSYMKLRSNVPVAAGDLWELNDNGFWELNSGGGYWELNG